MLGFFFLVLLSALSFIVSVPLLCALLLSIPERERERVNHGESTHSLRFTCSSACSFFSPSILTVKFGALFVSVDAIVVVIAVSGSEWGIPAHSSCFNTNVDGKQKIMFTLRSIKGIDRRFANIICKKADVDMNKRFLFLHSLFSNLTWVFEFGSIWRWHLMRGSDYIGRQNNLEW